MPKFTKFISLTPVNDTHWRVERGFTFFPEKFAPVFVPGGFETDLASVPRFLWTLIPPFGKHSQAAVIHDFLYKMRKDITFTGPKRSRKECDQIFLDAMKALDVPMWKRQTMYRAVRAFGWAH